MSMVKITQPACLASCLMKLCSHFAPLTPNVCLWNVWHYLFHFLLNAFQLSLSQRNSNLPVKIGNKEEKALDVSYLQLRSTKSWLPCSGCWLANNRVSIFMSSCWNYNIAAHFTSLSLHFFQVKEISNFMNGSVKCYYTWGFCSMFMRNYFQKLIRCLLIDNWPMVKDWTLDLSTWSGHWSHLLVSCLVYGQTRRILIWCRLHWVIWRESEIQALALIFFCEILSERSYLASRDPRWSLRKKFPDLKIIT